MGSFGKESTLGKKVLRILCVDADSRTGDWIDLVLRSSKISVQMVTAESGREAFRILTSENFDLCILDYALPDMTGVQLCSLMRHMGSDVPMLFFTAMNREIDRQKAAAAGAADYLTKPDDLDIFVDSVSHLLKMGRLSSRRSRSNERLAIAA